MREEGLWLLQNKGLRECETVAVYASCIGVGHRPIPIHLPSVPKDHTCNNNDALKMLGIRLGRTQGKLINVPNSAEVRLKDTL